MRFSGKFALKLGAVGVAAGAILTVPATAAHATGPSITITPNADVANNSAVTIDGTGFPVSDTTAFIVECGDTSGAATCDTTNVVTAPLTAGAFTGASITVKTGSLGTSGSCAAAGTCFIAVSSSVGTHDATNSTANTFTFAAAPAGPAITLTPNSNVANNSAITVDGTGFPVADTTAFIVECGDTSGAATCDTTNVVTAPLTAGAFTGASITVKTGSLGTSGSCAAAGTCYIAVSSSVGTHDATNSTASTFTFGTTAVPAITVTPHNGLKNGDSVVVSGTGYPAAASVVVIECSANPPTGPADCDITDIPGHLATTDGSGAFTKSITMKTGPIGGGTCSVGSTNCSVAAGTTDQLHKAYAPVVFAGATGPQASANHETNVKDGETLKISGSGFPKKVNPLYILECSTKTCGTQGSNGNLGTGILGTKSTTANGTFSKLPLKVQEGKFGSASCKAGGKCYIAVATSTDPTPSESALITFTFAKGGASHGPAKTKTIAAFSKKKDAIGGVVRSAGKGVKGLKTKLEIKAGKKWKKVAAHKTHKGGVFLYKHIKKNGKYKVVTAKTKHYKASSSKTLKVKLA